MFNTANFEVVQTNVIYRMPYDVKIFALKPGSNREVVKDNVKKIAGSISKSGWNLAAPLQLYWDEEIEKLVPADGQNRLMAAIELGADLIFTVLDKNPKILGVPNSKIGEFKNVIGTTDIPDTIQTLNNGANSNWTSKDRSVNKAQNGNENFKFVEGLRTATGYDNGTLNAIMTLAGTAKTPYSSATIDNGSFKCDFSLEGQGKVNQVLTRIEEFKTAIPFQQQKKLTGRGLKALMQVMGHKKKYQHEVLIAEIKADPKSWVNGVDYDSCIDMVTEFHNKNLKKSERIIRNENCKSPKSPKYLF